MKQFSTLVCCLILLSCDHSQDPKPLSDPIYFVLGVVVDSANWLPLDSVQVGSRDVTIPDSFYFVGDSARADAPYPFTYTQSDGSFELMWFGTDRDRTKLQLMYAYKSGYKLWRYDVHPVQVRWIDASRDEITIPLAPK